MYQPIEDLRGVWGLEARPYSQAEIDASEHLQWAVRAGALVAVEEKPHIPAYTSARDEENE